MNNQKLKEKLKERSAKLKNQYLELNKTQNFKNELFNELDIYEAQIKEIELILAELDQLKGE
jgi:hypothetical protein